MPRHVLIRSEDGESVVRETALPAEKNLHDVLTSYPQLVPSDDLELDRTVVVGRESALESRYADLVLVDRTRRSAWSRSKRRAIPILGVS